MDTQKQIIRNRILLAVWENCKNEYTMQTIVETLNKFNLSLAQAYKVLRELEVEVEIVGTIVPDKKYGNKIIPYGKVRF